MPAPGKFNTLNKNNKKNISLNTHNCLSFDYTNR